jgi:hypothetical protein
VTLLPVKTLIARKLVLYLGALAGAADLLKPPAHAGTADLAGTTDLAGATDRGTSAFSQRRNMCR